MVVAFNVCIMQKTRCFLKTTVGKNTGACLYEAGFRLTKAFTDFGCGAVSRSARRKIKTYQLSKSHDFDSSLISLFLAHWVGSLL